MIDFKKLSLKDCLDLAILVEEEARERYESFAEQIGGRYKGDAGDFFIAMAANEGKHEEELRKRRKELFQDAPTTVDGSMIWDVEAPDAGKPRAYMSPRQAMLLALDAEKKAYHFFDDALKHIQNDEVRALYLELRQEEVSHQQMLQNQLDLLPADGGGPDLSEDDVDEPPQL
ncbi:ferritin family protein [Bdellovibrionota bacterium FG-1]